MSSIMEAVAMNTVIETAQVYREKRQVKTSSGYLKNYLPKNNTQLLKCCTLLGKKRVHNQCPSMHSPANVMDLAGRTADEECSSPSPEGLEIPGPPCTAHELKNCLQPCHMLPCSCFTLNTFLYTN